MRNKLSKNFSGFVLSITVLVLVLTACNPRNLPGFRQLSESEERRMRKAAEEKIETSPVFQDLNRLCTQEIPLYESFSLVNFHASWKKPDYLSYFYFSDADWRKVKAFYKDYFAQHGWQLVDEYDTNWGSNKVEVKKDSYRVVLYNKGLGEDANYGFHCQKLSDTDKVE